MLYVTSEGQAGVIGTDLTLAIEMMISLPRWHDCLKFSGHGVWTQMQRAAAQFEKEIREERPGIDDVRDRVRGELGLVKTHDPLKELHHSLRRDYGFSVVSADGLIFESLFGRFTLDQRLGARRHD